MRSGAAPTAQQPRKLDIALLRGMSAIVVFAAINGIARIVQDVSIAWRFGTAQVVDAYYFAINLINWPVGVALSVLTLLAAPAIAARSGDDANAGRLFQAELLGAVLLISAISLPVAWWLLRAVATGPVGGLEPATAVAALAGVSGLVAAAPLGLVGALLSAWFVARGRHVLTLLEGLPPAVLAALVLFVPGQMLFWGTSIGVAVQVIAMALILHRAGDLPTPRIGVSAGAWHGFTRGAAALLIGHSAFSMLPLVDAFFAARLGDGMIAALNFANRLVLGVMGLAGVALQRSGLPLLSATATEDPWAARRLAFRWARIAAVVGVAMTATIWLLSAHIVTLLFDRGNFTISDGQLVADLLRYGMLQVPAYLSGMVLVTALAALQMIRPIMFVALAGLGVKLTLSIILSYWLGTLGLQLATALMYVTTAALCWLALSRGLHSERV